MTSRSSSSACGEHAARAFGALLTGECLAACRRGDHVVAAARMPSDVPSEVRHPSSFVAHALAKGLVAAWADEDPAAVRLYAAASGKLFAAPVATAPGVSISHSGDWVMAAVGPTPRIGVDLEEIATWKPRLLSRCFADVDASRIEKLSAAERDAEFTRAWVIAEACAKASGGGVREILQGCRELGAGKTGRWDSLTWTTRQDIPGYRWALASSERFETDPVVVIV